MPDPSRPGVADTVRANASGQTSARAATDEALDRIRTLDPGLNAFSVVLDEPARAEAAAVDERPGGQPGPLHGVPVAI
ncbi:MAG: amidase family protein, partial [Nocardioides sp.]